ncbi:hypothetical protein D3C86_1750500 [compost metagenome]
MDALLGRHAAVGVGARHDDGRALDARFFTLGQIDQFDLVALGLGPAGVHAQEHLGPVLGVGAARAGVDRDDGRRLVVLAAEHLLHLPVAQGGADAAEALLDLGQDREVP